MTSDTVSFSEAAGVWYRDVTGISREAATDPSLDAPAGVDATTGEAPNPTGKATATFTLALPKDGLLEEGARGWVEELYLGDIGVPSQVYERFGFAVDGLFSLGDILYLGSMGAEPTR